MPPEDIDALEILYPGLTLKLVTAVSGMFDARLRKRYAAPFQSPFPDALKLAVIQVAAYRLWLKRGFNPSAAHNDAIKEDKDSALEWLKEAADGEKGLIELPPKEEALGTSAINVGSPLGSSEQSPYVWTDRQAIKGRDEDANG